MGEVRGGPGSRGRGRRGGGGVGQGCEWGLVRSERPKKIPSEYRPSALSIVDITIVETAWP